MQAILHRIISFFMTILAFFGIVKTPAAPAQPDTPVQQSVRFIAHRGATFAAPENTLPAIEHAARDSCAGVEIDVRQTKDGVLVLSHNASVRGKLNGAETSRSISGSTYAALCEISLGQDENNADIRIPTLRQALELLRTLRLEAVIHCKLQNSDFLQQVARTVTECGMSGRCAYNTEKDFGSTIPAVLNEDPAASFHVPLAEALADPSIRELTAQPAAIVATVAVASLKNDTAAQIRAEGFSFYIWNVNADNLKTALAAAPDYIEFVSGVSVTELLASV